MKDCPNCSPHREKRLIQVDKDIKCILCGEDLHHLESALYSLPVKEVIDAEEHAIWQIKVGLSNLIAAREGR